MAMSPSDGATSNGQAVVSGSAVVQNKMGWNVTTLTLKNRKKMTTNNIIFQYHKNYSWKFYAHACHQIWQFDQEYSCCNVLAEQFNITTSTMTYVKDTDLQTM